MKLVLTIVDDGRVRTMAEIERDVIEMAISVCGNRSAAARALGMGRSTLHRKLPPPPRQAKHKPKRKPAPFPGRLEGPMNLRGAVTRDGPAWIKGKRGRSCG